MSSIERPIVDIEAKRREIQNEIEEYYMDFEQDELNNNQYDCVERNLLLVGPSKSGKTTLTNMLIDPKQPAEELSLLTVLRTEATCEKKIDLQSLKITLNIVEMPETMINSVHSLPMINAECHRLGIQNFHLICLCASFETGINAQALESFERFINYFGPDKVRSNLCLIVTRCESKDEQQREKLRKELSDDVDYKRISQNCGRGIHFSGALNRDDWNRANDSLFDQFETIYSYRKNLLNLIRTDIRPFRIPKQQQRPSSISKNVSTNFSPPAPTSIDQPANLESKRFSGEHSMLHRKSPDQTHKQYRPPSEPAEETTLINKRSTRKVTSCCSIC